MICWADDLLEDREKLEAFTDAVVKGAVMYADESTADRMNKAFEDHGLPFEVRVSRIIDPGVLLAIDLARMFDPCQMSMTSTVPMLQAKDAAPSATDWLKLRQSWPL